jgi:hypothetical protein
MARACLWLCHLPDSEMETGGLHGKDRSGLEAELEKLSQYGKLAKKTLEKTLEKSPEAAPVVKAKKSDENKKSEEVKELVAKAA